MNHTVTTAAALATLFVTAAIAIDLVTGIHRSRLQGTPLRSRLLRRTLHKFISYVGAILIAAMADVLLSVAGVPGVIPRGTPVITALLGLFLLGVEVISIYENADGRTRDFVRRLWRIVTSMRR